MRGTLPRATKNCDSGPGKPGRPLVTTPSAPHVPEDEALASWWSIIPTGTRPNDAPRFCHPDTYVTRTSRSYFLMRATMRLMRSTSAALGILVALRDVFPRGVVVLVHEAWERTLRPAILGLVDISQATVGALVRVGALRETHQLLCGVDHQPDVFLGHGALLGPHHGIDALHDRGGDGGRSPACDPDLLFKLPDAVLVISHAFDLGPHLRHFPMDRAKLGVDLAQRNNDPLGLVGHSGPPSTRNPRAVD